MRPGSLLVAAAVVGALLLPAVPAVAETAVPSTSSSPSPQSASSAPLSSASPSTTSPSPSTTSPSPSTTSPSPSEEPADAPHAADVPAAVPRSLALVVPPSTIVWRRVTLTGLVEGEAATTVTLDRRVGTTWVKAAQTAVAPTGEWSLSWLADTPGTVKFRATTTFADGTTVESAAASMLVIAAVDAAVSAPLLRTDVPRSYRNGCPVAPDRLRRLLVNYWDYSGKVRRGTLIVAASAAPVVQRAFTRAFSDRFRIKRMTPADYFYGPGVTPTGSDIRMMNQGNTSAFNCRGVTGARFRVSQHSYGNAIDINTFENPYVTASKVYPAKAKKRYVKNRSKHLTDPGVLRKKSGVTKVFRASGWAWGGYWSRRDWQHFSANGR